MTTLGNIEFQFPWAFILWPILIYGYYFIDQKIKQKPKYIRYSQVDNLMQYSNWKTRWHKLPDLLRLLSIMILVIALARPRMALVNQSIKGQGIDIVMAMDISSSMLTQDFQPDRLEVSKKLAEEFIDKRVADRIGLVVFAGESFTQCPVTVDHDILKQFIQQQTVGYLEDGTAIGMGLATAVNRHKNSQSKSKIIILLTDGVNNKGYIDPEAAILLAKERNIKVYTIGIGSDQIALGPIGKSMSGDYVFDYIKGDIDEQLLTRMASATGGQYYRAKSAEDLRGIYAKIDQLEKTNIEVAVLKKYRELFVNPLLFGLVVMILSFILEFTVFKKFP